MSGEHGHPDLFDVCASLRADLLAAADRLKRVEAAQSVTDAVIRSLLARVAALESAGAPQDIYDYWYGGKPPEPQTFGRKYGVLDLSAHDPGAAGLEFSLRYLNIKPTYQAGKTVGAIRPRLVRPGGDFTAYDDIEICRDALDEDGIALKTFVYFEAGEAAPTHWELKCIGGIASAEIGTRYSKKAIIKDHG